MAATTTIILTTQILISFTTVVFSMFMLYIGKDAGVYLPIITTVLSTWTPSPAQHFKSQTTLNTLKDQFRKSIRIREIGNGSGHASDIEQPLLSQATR